MPLESGGIRPCRRASVAARATPETPAAAAIPVVMSLRREIGFITLFPARNELGAPLLASFARSGDFHREVDGAVLRAEPEPISTRPVIIARMRPRNPATKIITM